MRSIETYCNKGFQPVELKVAKWNEDAWHRYML